MTTLIGIPTNTLNSGSGTAAGAAGGLQTLGHPPATFASAAAAASAHRCAAGGFYCTVLLGQTRVAIAQTSPRRDGLPSTWVKLSVFLPTPFATQPACWRLPLTRALPTPASMAATSPARGRQHRDVSGRSGAGQPALPLTTPSTTLEPGQTGAPAFTAGYACLEDWWHPHYTASARNALPRAQRRDLPGSGRVPLTGPT